MSANYEKRDGFTWVPDKTLNKAQETLLNISFDHQINSDILEAEMKLYEQTSEKKVLRNVCLYNVILFPVQYIFTLLLFGNSYAKERTILFKLSIKYLRNKITVEQFKNDLQKMIADGKII